MEKLAQLCQDVVHLWDKYHVMYLNGIKNTLLLPIEVVVMTVVFSLLRPFLTKYNKP